MPPHSTLGETPILTTSGDSVGSAGKEPSVRWQLAMKRAVRDPAELCQLLDLPQQFADAARRAAELFGLFVTREYLGRIGVGDPGDPLLRQVLPLDAEFDEIDGFVPDPLDEAHATPSPGLLHKYHSRALLVTTGACAIHCRYCFRRHFPYSTAPRSTADWRPAIQYLMEDTSIREVILSGGDPLTLVDDLLANLVAELQRIPHLTRLRVHTRLPIVIPQRVNDELLTWLKSTRLTPIVVVHVNHPQEIDSNVADALGRLVDAGIPVLNQAVLLAGVNDDADVLTTLSERLIDLRVMPYYLHLLDRVAATAHFEVGEAKARHLVHQLSERLPGYAVPRLARETAGEVSKTILV